MSQLVEVSILATGATAAFVAVMLPRRFLSATALCSLFVPLLVWRVALLVPLMGFAGFSGESDNPVNDLDFLMMGLMLYASVAVVLCAGRFVAWASRFGERGLVFRR